MKTGTELDHLAVAIWRHIDRNRYAEARALLFQLEADTMRDAANKVLEWGKRSGIGYEPYISKDATDIVEILTGSAKAAESAKSCGTKG